ncbi:alpha/beta hydrolase fold domain-containing protein [Aldersonia sp. NBC_00410]|uniref:alpha/beta hydrolase fold domain-containing protein n=1 Tax=Aldersonia sp. NBC_00410 TaxID=2975954 RepID=UPI002257E097|nr:alpha/beta hydrolase fold domain-containing protein [Aldersonia sp. NBC_00410]MCX5046456.1 alpha/beta hydrolase fold domain-containing protein [Aldersonia sp. NBC_00410]
MNEPAESSPGSSAVTGVAAGVPYLAIPPDTGPRADAPIVVGWHLLDAPRTESAFAAALPLHGLDAWRIYLGLPLSGSRGIPQEEVMRLGYEDAVANLHGPIFSGAVDEFRGALTALRESLPIGAGPLGLLGGSMGAAIAQEVALTSGLDIAALVIVSPLVRLRDAVAAGEQIFGQRYSWTGATTATADRMDFVARAEEFDAAGQAPVQIVVGTADDEAFIGSARELYTALAQRYRDDQRVVITEIDGMGHALAEEPGLEPAPQTEHAAAADGIATEWFRRWLCVADATTPTE